MNRNSLRAIPSVDKILQALGESELPAPMVVDAVRRELVLLRKEKNTPAFEAVISRMRGVLQELRNSRILPVINGTGILIHTNFGRAPLGTAAIEALSRVGANYNNLEYGLGEGARGSRAAYLERSLAVLCAAEAATVVNNNAAALVLILRHFCQAESGENARGSRAAVRKPRPRKNEVVISRGEMIQIGGGFRIPEILEISGARLREVGTTNKTSLSDYARAITRETALILKVHRSNFYMGGFVESPETDEIAELARKKRVPFVEDLGSGAILETQTIAGLEHETQPAELMRGGAPLVCFSGDKLLGGPQAGIIAGNANYIAALKRDPFFRALRCDKLILSALETTVDLYLRAKQPSSAPGSGETAADGLGGVPVIAMLRVSSGELRLRAQKMIAELDGAAVRVAVGAGKAQVGGGTLPRSAMESVTLEVTHETWKPQEIAAWLRKHSIPIIGYVSRGVFKLDLRTIFPSQDRELVRALRGLTT